MNQRIKTFVARLGHEVAPFVDTLALIGELYEYTPVAFSNGIGVDRLDSPAGTNEGSCKVFAFGKINGLSKEETLACFGEHYLAVLEDPEGTGHPNIRLFMRHGWDGIRFESMPLRARLG